MSAVSSWTSGDEGISNAIDIGFDFDFFGTTYSAEKFYIYSNGFITIGNGNNPNAGGNAFWNNASIPNAANPNGFIAPFWDDLDNTSTGGQTLYQVIGTAPNRKLIIQWGNSGFYGSSIPLGTFQIILHETTNVIQLQYPALIGFNSATLGSGAAVGLENNTGTDGYLYSYNSANLDPRRFQK